MPVLQVCDGLCLNDLEKWILMEFGYLILDFLDLRSFAYFCTFCSFCTFFRPL